MILPGPGWSDIGTSQRNRPLPGIALPDRLIDHAWIDLEYNGECLQQDPSGLLGAFEFGQFRGTEFTRFFVQEENFCFNDKGFAVISQLNRFRNGN